jgi:hypothetical protein
MGASSPLALSDSDSCAASLLLLASLQARTERVRVQAHSPQAALAPLVAAVAVLARLLAQLALQRRDLRVKVVE